MVLDGYLMTCMGPKEELGDRAKRMQEKAVLQGCSVNLKAVIGSSFKHLCVCFQLATSRGVGSFIAVVLDLN